MAESPLTRMFNAVSGDDFTNPTPSVRVPQAAPVQPVLPSEKQTQVADATQRINTGFASKGQFPTLEGEIARLNEEQVKRDQNQQALIAQTQDFNGNSTADLQSGSLLRRFRANVINDVSAAAGTVGSIALQLKNTPQTIVNLAKNADYTDEEIGAFNREQLANRTKQSTQIQRNALIADDLLSGTPGKNTQAITTLDRNNRTMQAQSEQDKALLNRDVSIPQEAYAPGVPESAHVAPIFGPRGTVRDQLNQLQQSQDEVSKSIGSQATGADNEWGTQGWTNTVNQQEISQRLAEENKGKSTLGAIANTVGEYLKNPGAVGMVTAQSLPYAAGLPGIISGTVGQFTQDVSDATGVRGDGGIMRSSEAPAVAGYAAADAGLNFAENLVASRAMKGLANTFTPAPIREAASKLMDNAIVSKLASTAPARAVAGVANSNVAKSALFEGLTEAAQNQIQTRNLLGDDRIDREGNIEAGVLGALSSVVMSSPAHIAQSTGRGIDNLVQAGQERARAAAEARNPAAMEARRAAADAAKPFENLTNPEHADYNPQAALRQQTNVFADPKATPEAKTQATERAAALRDEAEQNLSSVQAEVQQVKDDAGNRPGIEQSLAKLDTMIQENPDHPQLAQMEQMRQGLAQRITDMDSRTLDSAGQNDLVTRYDAAQKNAERIRSEYDKFVNASGLNGKVSPETTQENINAATDEQADQSRIDEAANHVVSHPMQYTPEQLRNLADDGSNRFSDSQREAIRKLADARIAQNELKTNLNVNADITGGGQGYRGLSEYMSDFSSALRAKKGDYAKNLMGGIDRFLESHTQKAAVVREAFDSGVPAQVIRKNGQWVINDGKNLTSKELKANGGLAIHKNSSKLVDNIESEVAAIQATRDAMDTMQKAVTPATTTTPKADAKGTTAKAEPKQEVPVAEAKVEEAPTKQPPIKNEHLKERTVKQQERIVPAEEQTQNLHADQEIDNETDNAPAPTQVTEDTANSDQTIATQTQEATKADGAVTALQPEGKSLEAARTEEAAKPVPEQNLVLTGLAQSVRQGFVNPLVTVKNFMSDVISKAEWNGRFTEVNRFLAKPMNDVQKNLIAKYVQFHEKVAADIDAAYLPKKEQYRYQDFMQFLTTDGKLDENTKTAITAAAFSWLGENGSDFSLIATRDDIASMLHIKPEEVTTATYNSLAEVGSPQRAVVQALGQRAYQALGFKVLGNVDPARAGRMQQALGMYAMHTMMKRGYFEATNMTAAEYVGYMTAGMGPLAAANVANQFAKDYLNGQSPAKSKQVFNFVRVARTEVNGELQATKAIKAIVEASKGTSGIMSKLFSFDGAAINPLVSKPGLFMQKSVGEFNQEVPSELADRLTKAQQQPYRINESVVNAMDAVAAVDVNALQHMMGLRTDEDTPFLHDRDRIGRDAKNNDILRALDSANEFIPTLATDEDGRKQAIYMPLTVWSNNRVGVASTTLNPQGNKIHRIMVGMQAHETTIPTNQAAVDGDGNVTDYGRFLLTVAQGMEEAPIQTTNGKGMPTVDKVTASTYLKGMQEYLESDRVTTAVHHMLNIIEGNARPRDIAFVKDMVAEFGMGPHSFQSLHALALAQQAKNKGEETFITTMGGESDGVTNGPILTNILYGTADNDLLARGGLYTKESGITNVPQYREQGNQDYYQLLGNAQKRHWDNMYPAGEGKAANQHEAFRRAMDALSSGYGTRGKAKVLATPFNYGSGFDALKRASARDTIDGIYKHITDIAKTYALNGKEAGELQQRQVEQWINRVLKQIPEVNKLRDADAPALRIPRFEGFGDPANLLSYELPKAVTQAIMEVEMATRGDASEAAVREVAAGYIATRDANTAIANAAFEASNVLNTRMEETLLNQKVEAGEVGQVNGKAIEGLTSQDKATLAEKNKPYGAVITSATGSISDNKLESGYVAAKASTTYSKTNDEHVSVNGFFAEPANPVNTGLGNGKDNTFRTYTASAQVKTKTAPGVSTGALVVQGTDAAISTSVIAQMPSQNFHDANLFGVKQIVEGAQTQNKAMWDTVTGYDSQLANTEALIRSMTGVSVLANQNGFTASDWNTVKASLAQLAFKSGYIKSPKDPHNAGVTLGRVVEDAYNREIAKLNTLKGIEYVNQYGYEGGEYQVTEADRKAIDKKIAALLTQRNTAVKEAQTLGASLGQQINAGTSKQNRETEAQATAQRQLAQEQAAADSESVSKATTQNSLERFLSGFKDGKVPAKDLMAFVAKALATGKTDGSTLHTRMQKTYSELAKVLGTVLPDNLEINIISGSTHPEGVKGAELNTNARAWYYADKDTNQINIKMDGQVGLEVVLHETLHAATARALDDARRNPKGNPALTAVYQRMTEMHSRIKQLVESNNALTEFLPAVRNVDEMLAWGMTNQRFQLFLDSVKGEGLLTPRKGIRARLGTAFKEFTTNVLNAVYAFTGRKPSAETISATEALILDTAELLQVAQQHDSNTELNLPMVTGSHSASAVGNYTHRQVFDSLVNAGGKVNSAEFTSALGNVIDQVSDKLFSVIGGDHLTSGNNSGYTPGQVWSQAIVDGKAPFRTKALAAGFRMTDQEAFAIESIESAVAASLNSGFGSAVNREIRKSWEAARKQIKPEAFHNGNWATATQAQKDVAQKQWDHLFTLEPTQNGTNRYLSQFVAMTLGHEETSKLMGFTDTVMEGDLAGKTPFETAARYASHAYNFASGLLSNTNSGQLINQKSAALAKQLIQIDLKNRDKSVGKLEQTFTYISDFAEEQGQKVLDKVGETADMKAIREAKSPIIRMAGSITSLTAKRNLNHLGDTMRQMRDFYNPNKADGWAAQILSDVMQADKVRTVFESLLRHTGLIEQKRRSLAEVTRSSIMEHFQDSGKYLTQEDHTAMTYTLLRSDAHSLLNAYSLEDVKDFVSSPSKRKAAIQDLEQKVLTEPNGNDMVIRAKALGYYLATGKATIPGLVKNAQAIASGAGTHYSTTAIADRTSVNVENIDSLASLYAIQYSNPEHLKRTATVMQRELANKSNGIEALLNTHKVLSEDATSTLFADNEISRAKGYIPEVTNPYRDVKVVESGERATMEQLGYEFVGMVPVDPTIPSQGQKAMYVTQDNGAQRYVSGATSLTSNHRKGSSAIQNLGYSKGNGPTVVDARKAVYAASRRMSQSNHSAFDPMSIKDTYMIPVISTDGHIMDFRYEMQHENRDNLLDRNNDSAHLLGQYAGQSFDKLHSPTQNQVIMEALHQDFTSNYALNPDSYVVIGPNGKDARTREIWAMLPEQTRFEAESIWGAGNGMQVRSDLVNLVFGFRKYSIGESFDKTDDDQSAVESFITGTMQSILGDSAKSKAVTGERAVQETMSIVKDFVVIRNIKTMVNNQLGNFTLLKAYGVPINDIIRDTKVAIQSGLSYRKNMAMLLKLQHEQRAGLGDFNANEQKILQLEDQIARNPLAQFIDAGMMPTIVDDVDMSDTDYTYTTGLKRKLNGVLEQVPQSVRTAAKYTYVTKDTPVYKFLANAMQFSDFSSKYVLYNYSKTKAKEKLSHEDALQRASDAFVNYDVPASRELQYMNDMGLFMFTKYKIRIQRAMLTLMKERPGNALAQTVLVSHFTNAQTALDPNVFSNLGNPLSSSVMQVPSALDEPFPIKLMSSLF